MPFLKENRYSIPVCWLRFWRISPAALRIQYSVFYAPQTIRTKGGQSIHTVPPAQRALQKNHHLEKRLASISATTQQNAMLKGIKISSSSRRPPCLRGYPLQITRSPGRKISCTYRLSSSYFTQLSLHFLYCTHPPEAILSQRIRQARSGRRALWPCFRERFPPRLDSLRLAGSR